MFELVESQHKPVVCGFLNSVDTITITVSTLYYLYVNKNWFNLCFGFTVVGAVSHFYMILCAPESPKWFLANNMRVDAIRAFNKIGKLNFVSSVIPVTAKFSDFPNSDMLPTRIDGETVQPY